MRLRHGSAGAAQTVISREMLSELRMPCPTIGEQERIVAVLDEAFEGIAAAKANSEKRRQLLTQLENAAGFPTEPILGKKRHALADLCEFIVDCEHKTAPTQRTGIPSIRTPNIGRGYLILDGVNRVSEETYRAWTRRAEPAEGDLIFAREAPAGNVAVIPPSTKLCLGQRTVLLRPKRHLVNSNFLAHLILHPATQSRWVDHSHGATVQHVNLKDIRALPIGSLPSLDEQAAVVGRIEELADRLGKASDVNGKEIAALDELKRSLLHQAFSGKL
jgi:type I restriction enzyme S subunit